MKFSQTAYETTRTELDASRRRYREITRSDGFTDVDRRNATLAVRNCLAAFHRSFGWQKIADDDEWKRLSNLLKTNLFPDGFQLPPAPFITWSVDHLNACNLTQLSTFQHELHRKCIVAIKQCRVDSPWYVLENVNHPWYRLHLDEMPDHFDPWPIEIIPNADPCYLVNENFSCGFVSQHGGPFSVFGAPLLDQFLTDLPRALTQVISTRRDV